MFPLPEWYLPNGTINASDDRLEGASSSCERWGLGFAAIVVISVIVELGISWAQPPYLLFLKLSAFADAAVAIGIAGEIALGTIWNNRIQTELRRRSNAQLASAIEAAGQAHERAAEANAQALEAQLALEKFRAPRMLDGAQRARIAEKLTRYAGQQFVGAVAPGVGDALALWSQIAGVLRQAGWVGPHSDASAGIPATTAITRPGVVIMFSTATFVAEATSATGTSIMVRADALASALKEEDIDATAFPARGRGVEATPNAIRIEIGPKR
jgi:hypothetical protein